MEFSRWAANRVKGSKHSARTLDLSGFRACPASHAHYAKCLAGGMSAFVHLSS